MNKIKKRKLLSVTLVMCLLLSSLVSVFGASTKYQPTDRFFINDFANILSEDTENQVFQNAVQIQEKTTAQLVVVTVPSLDGDDITSYANLIFSRFKIGDKEKDNGVLLLISSKDRQVRIEVGYGLEGAINDAKAGRILDDLAVPSLKENDYDSAVINVVKQLQGIIYQEYGIEGGFDDYANIQEKNPLVEGILSLVGTIIFIIIAIALSKRGIFFFGGGFGGFGGRRWIPVAEAAASQGAVVPLVVAVPHVDFSKQKSSEAAFFALHQYF